MTAGSDRASDAMRVPGYVVAERLGAGGFGEVYRAHHEVIGRKVAIKVLHAKYSADPAAVKRFVDEARAVNKISHPNIVEISDFGVLPHGRQYCVMELLDGMTLRDVLRERSRLPLADALPILRGIAEAVDAAHAVGIAHRDLKPDNVFVLLGGGIKLIDFGLAKLTHEDAVPVTETGAVFGTPLYMSPEQCRGNAVTVATDAYSFGVLAYHVLVGEPPFSGEAIELALHHLNDDPPAPSARCAELDAKVDRVVLALMAKDPTARPPSLVTALDALTGDAALPRVRRRFPRRLALALSAVALVGGGGATVLGMRGCVEQQTSECALAEDKLAGVWDEDTQRKLKVRFDAVRRPDVQATWKRISEDLDALMAAWAERWDASCTGTERETDPLLWAQRQACLENLLPAVRTTVSLLTRVDVKQFAYEVTFDFVAFRHGVPDICTDERQLRATPPPIPPMIRDRVVKLQDELGVVRTAYKEALSADNKKLVDGAVVRMREIDGELVRLGLSKFYEVTWRAAYLTENIEWHSSWIPAAREAISEGIQRAEDAYDDAALTGLYTQLCSLERKANSPVSVVEAAIDKLAASAGRIGRDPSSFHEVVGARAYLAAREGKFEEAIRLIRTLKYAPTDSYEGLGYAGDQSDWLLRLGRVDEAIAFRRSSVDFHVRKLGAVHWQVAQLRLQFAFFLADAGRFDEALAEIDTIAGIFAQIDLGDARRDGLHLDRLEIASRTNKPIDASYDQWRAIAQRALERGDVGVAIRAHDHVYRSTPARRAETAELGVYLALVRGDAGAMKEHARHLRSSSELDARRWWTAVAEVLAGNTQATPVELAALRSVLPKLQGPSVPVGQFFAGVLELGSGHMQDAVKSFDASRAALPHTRDFTMAEADAWLGHARVEIGDAAGAVAPLEESLAILANCCREFHYFAPLAQYALARALVMTGGDTARARTLAETARDGFTRLGGVWLTHHDRVVRWLATR